MTDPSPGLMPQHQPDEGSELTDEHARAAREARRRYNEGDDSPSDEPAGGPIESE